MKHFLSRPLLLLCIILFFCFVGCERKNPINSKEIDEQELFNLRSEINELSEQVNCENNANWKFTAIGAKACGGPTGFIAYSANINEVEFLKKVDLYTQKQKAFNAKWAIGSDCSAPSPPKAIECVNGKPKFIY